MDCPTCATGLTIGRASITFRRVSLRADVLVISKSLARRSIFTASGWSISTTSPIRNLRSWLWDEGKGWLLGSGTSAGIFVEMIYAHHSHGPAALVDHRLGRVRRPVHCCMQLAPVVLFPIFYKFEPLKTTRCATAYATRRAGRNAGARRLRVEAVGEIEEGQRRAHGNGATRRIILADTLIAELQRR